MLQIKNLTKVYSTKGGASVRALDGVTLAFEEKGMVFLLGKSGSGKSTLLNLCGGLDKPDSGEIIVKGRGSDTFSAGDFDSYRNTYIGFIFQEYNILNEFTVEENIALALELQGKAKDKNKIGEILKAVEMEQFARRKPNTLSGGQKQRIAIARALVKDPEIIMADEPTGALDSNTGRQVFDTLKKLSEEKLVIVVSHDREFAEIYGDRIIELKDGKVISDVTKSKIAATVSSDNVAFIGNDAISVKSGAKLTEADMKKIRDFIAASPENVLISNSGKDIAGFKKQARIDENGAREKFSDTRPEDISVKEYRGDESKFIRSKLPLRHAARIGASSMKVKPFRLFFTILLTFISFVMFGLFSTLMLFSEQNVLTESLKRSDDQYLNIVKKYNYVYNSYRSGELWYSYGTSAKTLLKEEDAEDIFDVYGSDSVIVFDYNDPEFGSYSIMIGNINGLTSDFYTEEIAGFGIVSENSAFRGEKILWGSYPSGDDELMISDFTFRGIAEAGSLIVEDDSSPNGYRSVTVREYSDLENAAIYLGRNNGTKAYKITGVYKAADVPEEYETLADGNGGDYNLSYAWNRELQNGFYTYALVSDAFYEGNRALFSMNYMYESSDTYFKYTDGGYRLYDEETGAQSYLYSFSSFPAEEGYETLPVYGTDGEAKTALADYDIVLSMERYAYCLREYVNVQEMSDEAYSAWWYGENDGSSDSYQQKLEYLLGGYRYDNEGNYYELGGAEALELYKDVKENFLDAYGLDVSGLQMSLFYEGGLGEAKTVTLAGFFLQDTNYTYNECAYAGAEIYADLRFQDIDGDWRSETVTAYDPTGGKYSAAFVAKTDDSIEITMRRLFNANSDDSFFDVENTIKQNLQMYIELIGVLSKVFLYVGIAFAVFSMLLLFNFISVSIANKKKEIGILRAVGARSTDVFKIFFSETAIITGICLILSVVASLVLCTVFNTLMSNEIGLPLSMFVFGPMSVLIMIGIAVVTAILSTFLPVYSIAKKRPVESIRAL